VSYPLSVTMYADARLRRRGHGDQLKRKCKLVKYHFCVTKILAHLKYCQSNHCQVSRSSWLWHELRATIESWYKDIDIYVYNSVASLFLMSTVTCMSILSSTFHRIFSSLPKRRHFILHSCLQIVIKIN
jgi:hypothetical protein